MIRINRYSKQIHGHTSFISTRLNTKHIYPYSFISTFPSKTFLLPKEAEYGEAGGYINGQWTKGISGKTLPVINPCNGKLLTHVPNMIAKDAQAAIDAATQAQVAWGSRAAPERANILRKLHTLMQTNMEGLATLLTLECGKPMAESRGEIAYAASFVEWYAEEARRGYGEIIPSTMPGRRMFAFRGPVGVAALLTPWNFSSAMVTRKLAPALAAGCSVILRPSAETPLSAMAIVALAEEAGIPPGVINLIVGHDHTALAGTLASSRQVAKLSFTGSTRVGTLLATQCASTLKRVSFELGGNAPFIVFSDADIDAAVDGAMASKFRNAGQTCVCANRIFVHADVYTTFKTKLLQRVEKLIVGDGMLPNVTIGPLISQAALNKTSNLVNDAVSKGASVLIGGKQLFPQGIENGFFYAPTILEGITKEMNIAHEEIFGPVAPLQIFTDESDVITKANNTDVGLAAYIFTRDIHRVWRVADALQVGMVGVNTGIISTVSAPFGGIKMSGYGREGGRYGMDEYLQIKYINM